MVLIASGIYRETDCPQAIKTSTGPSLQQHGGELPFLSYIMMIIMWCLHCQNCCASALAHFAAGIAGSRTGKKCK
jgi:hypothetical protein